MRREWDECDHKGHANAPHRRLSGTVTVSAPCAEIEWQRAMDDSGSHAPPMEERSSPSVCVEGHGLQHLQKRRLQAARRHDVVRPHMHACQVEQCSMEPGAEIEPAPMGRELTPYSGGYSNPKILRL